MREKVEVEAKELIGKSGSGIVNEGLGDCHEWELVSVVNKSPDVQQTMRK